MASPEVQRLRARLESQAGAIERGQPPTVRAVCTAFLRDASTRYTKRPGLCEEMDNVRIALRPLLLLYGDELADSLGPLQMRALQLWWCERGLAVTTINGRAGRVRRVWRWAASVGMVAAGTAGALGVVASVRPPQAPAPPPVEAAPIGAVERVLAHLERPPLTDGCVSVNERPRTGITSKSRATLAAMIRVQLATGMRPGELCAMEGRYVLGSHNLAWTYSPPSHKGSWRRRPRVIPLGPQAMAALTPRLVRSGSGHLFTTCRGTPYNSTSYGHEVTRACDRAGVDHWSPNQLRHLAATLCAQRVGADVASRILGHADQRITRTYLHDEPASAYAARWG